MGFEQTQTIWMNGALVPWAQATIHVSAHGLHYGTGVFEGIRCYDTPHGPAVFRLREHMQRFFDSGRPYGMALPYSLEQLEEAVCEVVRENGFRDCYIRPIAYRGSGSLRLDSRSCPVEVAILAWPWARYLGEEGAGAIRISVSPWRKFHASMMPTAAKACGQYLNSVLATQEASQRGYDEALLLDAAGAIAEGAGENLFLVREGQILTNDPSASLLPGITREAVLTLAREAGVPAVVQALELEDLYRADEAFFTGTATEIAAIGEVDGRRIGGPAPGPVTRRLQALFRAATTGGEPRWGRLVAATNAAAACAAR